MTPPRCVLANETIELTQRTLNREFRLLPRREINQLFLYVLGVAAERYGVVLYGLTVMTTHYHLCMRDVEGQMPAFALYLNSTVARALNALQGRSDKVWSGRGYHDLHPQTGRDVVRRIVYGMANPGAAGLVNRIEDYPGVAIRPDDIGRDIVVERPKFFFRQDGVMPDTVTLRFEIPPEFEELGLDAYRALLWERLRDAEKSHRKQRRADGRAALGAKKLRQVALGQRASSWERWFALRPKIAARVKAERLRAIRALKAFRAAYRAAWQRWMSGDRDAVFPRGTWWLPRYAGALVDSETCESRATRGRRRPRPSRAAHAARTHTQSGCESPAPTSAR